MENVLSRENEEMVARAFCLAAELQQRAATMALAAEEDRRRPHVLLRPRVFIDGNAWCALYGENIQDGVCGFGDSPEAAMLDFDRSFCAKLPVTSGVVDGAA